MTATSDRLRWIGSTPITSADLGAADWLIEHLTHGPDDAPWCVWAKRSIETGMFAWTSAGQADNSPDRFVRRLASTFLSEFGWPRVMFSRLPYTDPSWLAALSTVVPNAVNLDEEVVQAQRHALLADGLMCGFLHSQSSLKSLTRRPGLPFNSPHRILTIRWATPLDRIFLSPNADLSGLLQTWLERLHFEPRTLHTRSST